MLDERILDTWIDGNGCFVERKLVNGQEIVVHHDDIPDKDRTVVRGIPVTTPVRTCIDCGGDMSHTEFVRMVAECLDRGLFTPAEAYQRIAEPDMRDRKGAIRLGEVLDGMHCR